MRFITFSINNQTSVGMVDEAVTFIIDLRKAQIAKKGQTTIPDSLIACIEQGDIFIKQVQEVLSWSDGQGEKSWVYPLDEGNAKIIAPIPRPSKNIFCVGKNYAAHVIEMGSKDDIPQYPMLFSKVPTTVIGPDETILNHKDITNCLDYEGELAVVIGKKGRAISSEEALEYVFGYTIINDITARDIQKRHQQFLLGKSLDTSCPMGPFIAHKSLIPDPNRLGIQTKVNGELRQSANTQQFIFNVQTIIATISAGITLEPGDIIATGTPAGVGNGFNPPRFLQPGDKVEVTVEGLGTLTSFVER